MYLPTIGCSSRRTGSGTSSASGIPVWAGSFPIAAKNADRHELAHEVADLWFHTFVLLAQQGITPEDVWDELRTRRKS